MDWGGAVWNRIDNDKEIIMDIIYLFIIGIAALSGLLAVIIYLLAVSREMQLKDVDEV